MMVCPVLFRALLPIFSFVLVSAACRREVDRAGGTATDSTPTPATAAGAPAEPPGGTATTLAEAFAFTNADLDAYERGFAKEIELVKAAKEREMAATTPEERARATQAQWEDQTAAEAARSLGLPPERYRLTRDAANRVLETLDFQGKIEGPKEVDVTRAPPELRDRLTSDPFAEFAPASATALRARLDRLVPLWVEYVNLTAVGG